MDSRNKILIKNTVAQYIRIIVSVFVHLWCTRIVLNQLGISDYGIYSVVAGFIALFGILNASMIVSIQRYLSYNIRDAVVVKEIYSNAIFIHWLIALALVLLAETLGLYFVKNYMSFPDGRLETAIVVFHCVVISFALNVVSIPQQAALVAFEKIYLSSLVGIVEVLLKLGISLSLVWFASDKLVVYSLLLVVVALVVRVLYVAFARRGLRLRFRWTVKRGLLKQLMGFAGWNLLGGMANLGKIQGVNVLLNMFFGTVVNAAYGIANQINSQLLFFSNSVFQSTNSQIVQSYSNGEWGRLDSLVCRPTKFAFLLFFLITLPFYACAKDVLFLWLGKVPDYCLPFLKLMFINSYIELFSTPLMFLMQASGKIRLYFIVVSAVMILILPISYVALRSGCEPSCVLIVTILINLILIGIRILFVQKVVAFSCRGYVMRVLFPAVLMVVIAVPLFEFVYAALDTGIWTRLILVVAADILLIGGLGWRFFLSSSERGVVCQLVKTLVHKFYV